MSVSTSLRKVLLPISRLLNLVQVAAEVSEGRKFVDFGGKCCLFLQYDYTTFQKNSKTLACVGFHDNQTEKASKT